MKKCREKSVPSLFLKHIRFVPTFKIRIRSFLLLEFPPELHFTSLLVSPQMLQILPLGPRSNPTDATVLSHLTTVHRLLLPTRDTVRNKQRPPLVKPDGLGGRPSHTARCPGDNFVLGKTVNGVIALTSQTSYQKAERNVARETLWHFIRTQ